MMKTRIIYTINNLGKKFYIFLGIFIILLLVVVIYFLIPLFKKNSANNINTVLPVVDIGINETKTEVNTEIIENEIKKEEVKIDPLPIGTDRFTVFTKDTNENISNNLFEQGYILDIDSFIKLLSGKDKKGLVLPGAYKISKEMNDAQLVQVLNKEAYMKWVIVPEGLRKEEIGKLLKDTLGWSEKEYNEWIAYIPNSKMEYKEGVYFPDTYLIPIDEKVDAIANRFISKFNENFSSYLIEFTNKNIKWTGALTLASIVQREASSKSDMPLIAGILWNRLDQKMQLGVDATLQYMRGDVGNGWWAKISIEDKKNDSPYNTYKYKGLPPYPISNPGISAIDSVLNPTETDCLYYIHDKNQITHCAVTYEEHLANIEEYLK